MSFQEQQWLNSIHSKHPYPGDYWHEMFCPYFVVLEPVSGGAIVCDKKIEDREGWTWDLKSACFMSDEEIEKQVRYRNYDGFVADVCPAAHMRFVRQWQELGSPKGASE